MSLSWKAIKLIGVPSAASYTGRLPERRECSAALDVGCGSSSPLSVWRPAIHTTGIDISETAIKQARANQIHDEYLVGDLLDPHGLRRVWSGLEESPPDIVTLYGVIEHLPKRMGFELLERCERLTTKYVLLETPNGFLPQGPEFGNEYQRHLSGWFPHDFEGLGYGVFGSSGLRAMMGYAAGLRWNFPGAGVLNAVASRLARIGRHPHRAFNLVAIKDIRGVDARLDPAEAAQPKRAVPQAR